MRYTRRLLCGFTRAPFAMLNGYEVAFRYMTRVFSVRARLSSFSGQARVQNPSLLISGFSGFSVLQSVTIYTSFKMTHIEAKSILFRLRYVPKWMLKNTLHYSVVICLFYYYRKDRKPEPKPGQNYQKPESLKSPKRTGPRQLYT